MVMATVTAATRTTTATVAAGTDNN
jgi:hypothetical protein